MAEISSPRRAPHVAAEGANGAHGPTCGDGGADPVTDPVCPGWAAAAARPVVAAAAAAFGARLQLPGTTEEGAEDVE